MWTKITAVISSLGQSIQFCAWFAHFGVASIIAEHVYTRDPLWTLMVIVALGAAKEFLYDALYEANPPQTFWDNLEDFSGWCAGGLVGFGFAVGWW